jgi:hypothetical protein
MFLLARFFAGLESEGELNYRDFSNVNEKLKEWGLQCDGDIGEFAQTNTKKRATS